MSINLEAGKPANITGADVLKEAAVVDPASWSYLHAVGPDVPGLTVDVDNGITGTPTTPGTYTFTIKGSDKNGYNARAGAFSIVVTAAPKPEHTGPDPLPVKVCKFLGLAPEGEPLALAEQHTRVVATFVRNYVRGNGFRAGDVVLQLPTSYDLEDVIVSAAARSVVNPSQAARQNIGDQGITYASLEGFTLTEKAVLHRYRRRTA
ncbi:putative Ig domain-containing protein [Rothia kristinae]